MWNPWNNAPYYSTTDHSIDRALSRGQLLAAQSTIRTLGLPGLVNQTMSDQDTIWLSVRPHLIKTARVDTEFRKTTVNL